MKSKNVDYFLKVISIVKADIPDIKCAIVGDGSEKKKIRKSL